MAVASRRASAWSTLRMWKARRWAVFGPMPGSRVSSATRSWTGPANSYRRRAGVTASPHAGKAHASGKRSQALRGEGLLSSQALVDGGADQVFEQAGVLGVDRGRVDGHAARLLAGELDLDRPAARRALDHGLGQLRLGLGELRLHLLDLLHHLVHVHQPCVSSTISAAKPSRMRSIGSLGAPGTRWAPGGSSVPLSSPVDPPLRPAGSRVSF